MTLEQLRSMPEGISRELIESAYADRQMKGFHESVLKSYQVLQKVTDWLEKGTHPSVVLEMIDDAYAHIPPEAR